MQAKTKLLIALLIAASLVTAITVLADDVYLPLVPNDPTNTPTLTPTLTLTPAGTVTRTPTPTKTPLPDDLYISDMEPDPSDNPLNEWIEITNNGDNDVDMEGWWIKADDSGARYDFPDDFTLDEGDSVQVWTRTGNDTSTDLFWDRTEPAWDDDNDTAYLRDADGEIVDTYSY